MPLIKQLYSWHADKIREKTKIFRVFKTVMGLKMFSLPTNPLIVLYIFKHKSYKRAK